MNKNDYERARELCDNLIEFVSNKNIIDDAYYIRERGYFVQKFKINIDKLPKCLVESSNLKIFTAFLYGINSDNGIYKARRKEIQNQFSSFLLFLEINNSDDLESFNANEFGCVCIDLCENLKLHLSNFLKEHGSSIEIEEAFKIVIEKIENLTEESKASSAFNKDNIKKIFPKYDNMNQKEKDFCDGIKYLCMSIQFFRNNVSHQKAYKIDENISKQFIIVANLALFLLSSCKK